MDDDENMGGRILRRRDIAKLKWVDVGMTDDATLQRRSVVRMDNYPQWLIDLKRDHDDVPGSEVKFWTAAYMPAEPTAECVTALVKAWLQDWTEVCASSVFYELDGWPKHENQWGDKHRRRYRKELVGPSLGSLRELLPLLVRAKITGFVGRPIREIPVDVERKTLTNEQLMDLLRGLHADLTCSVEQTVKEVILATPSRAATSDHLGEQSAAVESPSSTDFRLKVACLAQAKKKLKHGRLRIVEIVCEADSGVELAKLGTDSNIGWELPYDSKWSSAQRDINKVLGEVGAKLRRHDGQVLLEAIPAAKTTKKTRRKPDAAKAR